MDTMQERAFPDERKSGGVPWWGWLLILLGAAVLLLCLTCVGGIVYIGSVSPETSVYTANRVPQSYRDELTELGVLEPREDLKFFYSDGFTAIRSGSYTLTDRGVVLYGEAFDPPLQRYPFEEIAAVSISRDTSFLNDSQVTLELTDGTVVGFPLSSEHDRDVAFVEAIEAELEARGAAGG